MALAGRGRRRKKSGELDRKGIAQNEVPSHPFGKAKQSQGPEIRVKALSYQGLHAMSHSPARSCASVYSRHHFRPGAYAIKLDPLRLILKATYILATTRDASKSKATCAVAGHLQALIISSVIVVGSARSALYSESSRPSSPQGVYAVQEPQPPLGTSHPLAVVERPAMRMALLARCITPSISSRRQTESAGNCEREPGLVAWDALRLNSAPERIKPHNQGGRNGPQVVNGCHHLHSTRLEALEPASSPPRGRGHNRLDPVLSILGPSQEPAQKVVYGYRYTRESRQTALHTNTSDKGVWMGRLKDGASIMYVAKLEIQIDGGEASRKRERSCSNNGGMGNGSAGGMNIRKKKERKRMDAWLFQARGEYEWKEFEGTCYLDDSSSTQRAQQPWVGGEKKLGSAKTDFLEDFFSAGNYFLYHDLNIDRRLLLHPQYPAPTPPARAWITGDPTTDEFEEDAMATAGDGECRGVIGSEADEQAESQDPGEWPHEPHTLDGALLPASSRTSPSDPASSKCSTDAPSRSKLSMTDLWCSLAFVAGGGGEVNVGGEAARVLVARRGWVVGEAGEVKQTGWQSNEDSDSAPSCCSAFGDFEGGAIE
ncbi:hypothetical protein DFP72DRAFT_1138162 [Ephemerocybe angulata]|uniref:Uncharacterized protein n=1 Tax=Ephemerocybe angulata TaxID=980116 RepID=A0A8H6M1N2_9AGAR|nr:hypothetical protein DFP72DRAFT_1138162 [Tulosesus angulatus]